MHNPIEAIITATAEELENRPLESGLAPAECARWFAITLTNTRTLLHPLDDASLARAIEALFAGSLVDLAYLVRNGAMPLDIRLEALRSIASFYRDTLDTRVGDALQSTGYAAASQLQGTVFMIWDVSPLTYWPESGHAAAASRCIAETFGTVLRECRSPACIESALHGLGHLFNSNPEVVRAVVADWLRDGPDVDQVLLDYATCAAQGMVQ